MLIFFIFLGCKATKKKPNEVVEKKSGLQDLQQEELRGPILYSWVQAVATRVGEKNSHAIRLITSLDSCPNLNYTDGSILVGQVRAEKNPPKFPELVCEYPFYFDKPVEMDKGVTYPIIKDPTEVAIIGDTGCNSSQDCSDSNSWVFPKVSERLTFDVSGQFTLHVGDYIYQKKLCPDGSESCDLSLQGKSFKVWQKEFFEPLSKAFKTQVFGFIRGNHEDCEFAYEGFFRYLGAFKYNQECVVKEEPWTYTVGPYRFGFFDSAHASSSKAKDTEIYQRDMQDIHKKFEEHKEEGKVSFLVTHVPFWGFVPNCWKMICKPDFMVYQYTRKTITLQKAYKDYLTSLKEQNKEKLFKYFISGHLHYYDVLTFKDHDETQFVVGTSGAKLND